MRVSSCVAWHVGRHGCGSFKNQQGQTVDGPLVEGDRQPRVPLVPKPSTDAVASAVRHCRGLGLRTELGSAYETFLVAHRMERTNRKPTTSNADATVVELFGLLPDQPDHGRIYLFRDMWGPLKGAGRSSVWNVSTRAPTVTSTLFNEYQRPARSGGQGVIANDIRGGLRSNSAQLLRAVVTQRPSWRALAAVLLRNRNLSDEEAARLALRDYLGSIDIDGAVIPLPEADLDEICTDEVLAVPLLATTADAEFDPAVLPDDLLPDVVEPAMTSESVAGTSFDIVGDVVVDSRIERMLETAVRTYRAVLLVGPPGSGKNTLIKRLLAKAQQNPALLGLSQAPKQPLTRTPDESWTSFELVGGQAPVGDGLRYTSGAVLDAIQADRWLLLDETNRGDMDKIFGALLTWLSMDPVDLGTLRPASTTRITLGWNTEIAASTVEPAEGFDAGPGTPEVAFRAGRDWRLLGTYNPQDAQRVFRFGVALSRRFAIVPVPPLTPPQFQVLLEQVGDAQVPPIPELLLTRVAGLYAAHHSSPAAQLGPAVFLRMIEYVMSALASLAPGLPGKAELGQQDTQLSFEQQDLSFEQEEADRVAEIADTSVGTNSPDQTLLDELMAEAYLVRVGKYLATYDNDTLGQLGQAIASQTPTALSGTQWSWVVEHRAYVG